MDRVQRVLGWVLAGFCAYLLIVNPFGRASVGEPVWIVTDWITVAVMLLMASTGKWVYPGAKAIQLLCFLAVSIGALYSESQTVGLWVLDAGFFLALFYGWYRAYPLPKLILTGVLFFLVVYVFDKSTTNNNLMATINWMEAFILRALFFWFLYWSRMKEALLVAKSYKNELEKTEPENKERDNAT